MTNTTKKQKNENVSSENDSKLKKTVKETKIKEKVQEKSQGEEFTLQELKKQNELLQQQLSAFLAGATLGSVNNSTNNKNYAITTNMINGMSLSTLNGDVTIFIPYKQNIEIAYDEVFQMMKNSFVKKSFMKGSIEFVNNEDYEDFNIKNFTKISNQTIIDLFNKSSDEIADQLDKWTNSKIDTNLTHMVFNMIVDLSLENHIELSIKKAGIVSDYFKTPLEIGMANLRLYKQNMN